MSRPKWNKAIRRRIWSYISRQPFLYFSMVRFGQSKDLVISSDTSLVIEGFPRSANSFAEAAIRLSQPSSTNLAHHTHAAAQVIQAAALKIPCLVLIRDPIDASRSLVMHMPDSLDTKSALLEYARYYELVGKFRRHFVLADFKTVTSDFGRVLQALNEKFDLGLAPFQHTKENEFAVFARVDEISRLHNSIEGNSEPYSPHASADERENRRMAIIEARQKFDDPILAKLVNRARSIYLKLISGVDA